MSKINFFVIFLLVNGSNRIISETSASFIGQDCEKPSINSILVECAEEFGLDDEFCYSPDQFCTQKCLGRCQITDFSPISMPCELKYR